MGYLIEKYEVFDFFKIVIESMKNLTAPNRISIQIIFPANCSQICKTNNIPISIIGLKIENELMKIN